MQEINRDAVLDLTSKWLSQVVIGLGLCPFAAKPWLEEKVRLVVFDGEDLPRLTELLQEELVHLNNTPSAELETTLVITPNCLEDFFDYNQYLDVTDRLIEVNDWEGIFQIASFHPNYQFGGTEAEDRENLTNRSPYPIFHLLRESSIAWAVEAHPDPDSIPDTNIRRMDALSDEEVAGLFPYLKPQI
ncbi:DUF1415 domain-containing protein [Sessilibacter sp. MAH1]